MPVSPSKRYRNWLAVAFSATTIDGVKNVTIDDSIQDIREGADADYYPTHATSVFGDPSISVETQNAMVLASTPGGQKGIFTATLLDSYNLEAVGGGAMVFTTNSLAYIAGRTRSGPFNQLATQTLTFRMSSIDGVTNPISVAAVA